jgi:nitrogen fixation protein NifU and related proteins
MTDLQNLYQHAILDHYRNPRNFRKPENANRQAEGFNPFCGDKLSIFLQVENGLIRDAGFAGIGCAISTASASMMTECLKGKTEAEAEIFIKNFCSILTTRDESADIKHLAGDLEVFSGIRGYPVRIKCATLAWHAARSALRQLTDTVSTE